MLIVVHLDKRTGLLAPEPREPEVFGKAAQLSTPHLWAFGMRIGSLVEPLVLFVVPLYKTPGPRVLEKFLKVQGGQSPLGHLPTSSH